MDGHPACRTNPVCIAMACFRLLHIGYDTEVICVYGTEVICIYMYGTDLIIFHLI